MNTTRPCQITGRNSFPPSSSPTGGPRRAIHTSHLQQTRAPQLENRRSDEALIFCWWNTMICVHYYYIMYIYSIHEWIYIYIKIANHGKIWKERTTIKIRRSPHQIAWQNAWIISMLPSSNTGSTAELRRCSKRFPSEAKFKDARKQWEWFKTIVWSVETDSCFFSGFQMGLHNSQ